MITIAKRRNSQPCIGQVDRAALTPIAAITATSAQITVATGSAVAASASDVDPNVCCCIIGARYSGRAWQRRSGTPSATATGTKKKCTITTVAAATTRFDGTKTTRRVG